MVSSVILHVRKKTSPVFNLSLLPPETKSRWSSTKASDTLAGHRGRCYSSFVSAIQRNIAVDERFLAWPIYCRSPKELSLGLRVCTKLEDYRGMPFWLLQIWYCSKVIPRTVGKCVINQVINDVRLTRIRDCRHPIVVFASSSDIPVYLRWTLSVSKGVERGQKEEREHRRK